MGFNLGKRLVPSVPNETPSLNLPNPTCPILHPAMQATLQSTSLACRCIRTGRATGCSTTRRWGATCREASPSTCAPRTSRRWAGSRQGVCTAACRTKGEGRAQALRLQALAMRLSGTRLASAPLGQSALSCRTGDPAEGAGVRPRTATWALFPARRDVAGGHPACQSRQTDPSTPPHAHPSLTTVPQAPSPQDVYTEISALVKKRVAADAAAGVPEAKAIMKHTTGA